MPESTKKCRCGCGGSPDHVCAPWDVRHGRWCQFLDTLDYKTRGNTTCLAIEHKACGSSLVHPELLARRSGDR
jgi:hypothetical protein